MYATSPHRYLRPLGRGPWQCDLGLVYGGLWLVGGGLASALLSGTLGVMTHTQGVLALVFWLGLLAAAGGVLMLLIAPLTFIGLQTCPECLRTMRRGATTCPHCRFHPPQEAR